MERGFDERLSTRIEPFSFGTRLLRRGTTDDRFVSQLPLRRAEIVDAIEPASLMRVRPTTSLASPATRIAWCWSDPMQHGARWAPAFEAAGYRADPVVLMCCAVDPDRGPHRRRWGTGLRGRPTVIHETYRRDGRLEPPHVSSSPTSTVRTNATSARGSSSERSTGSSSASVSCGWTAATPSSSTSIRWRSSATAASTLGRVGCDRRRPQR